MGDPNNIANLLDQLGSSAAWQQAVAAGALNTGLASSTAVPNEIPISTEPRSKASNQPESSGSLQGEEPVAEVPSERVSALLELLGSNKDPPKVAGSSKGSGETHVQSKSMAASSLEDDPLKDPRYLSFAEALPLVTKLSQSSGVLKHFKEIRDEQNRLEKRYWDARQDLLQKQRKRVEELRTQVSLTGSLGGREVERLQESFRKELSELEQEEFLPAWDRLLTRQQATLERIKVPLMFETSDSEERRKQQQIINILEGLMGTT